MKLAPLYRRLRQRGALGCGSCAASYGGASVPGRLTLKPLHGLLVGMDDAEIEQKRRSSMFRGLILWGGALFAAVMMWRRYGLIAGGLMFVGSATVSMLSDQAVRGQPLHNPWRIN